MSSTEVVGAFIAAIERKDLDAALAYAAADIEYDNVPMPTVYGHDGVRSFLEPLVSGVDEVIFEVHRQLVGANVVMNERTDKFRVGETWIELPVTGVFEVRDGAIALWRDYFDLQTLNEQIAVLGGS